MQLNTARFGSIEFEPEDVITFGNGLIGFPFLKEFVLIDQTEGGPFRWLQSLDESSTAFLVVAPHAYVPDYAPEISDGDAGELELTEETPILTYTTVAIPPGKPRDMTINLAAPLIVNALARKAKQVVLDDDAYTIKHRVFPTANREDEAIAA